MESIFNDQYIKQYYYENILPNIVKEILTGKASGVKSINLESETNTSVKQNFHDNLLNIPDISIANKRNNIKNRIKSNTLEKKESNKKAQKDNTKSIIYKTNFSNGENYKWVVSASYKKLLKIFKNIIKLEKICNNNDISFLVKTKRKIFCQKMKNYRSKKDRDKTLLKLSLIEEMIQFAKSLINLYL